MSRMMTIQKSRVTSFFMCLPSRKGRFLFVRFKFQFTGQCPVTMRARCGRCRYFPDPLGNVTLHFKFQFIDEMNLVVGADAHIGPQEKCYEFAENKRKYANNTAGPMWASAPTDKFAWNR